ncbi:50S ribosomal protein L6 [Candidatus Chromulinivorax destructor]|uniref:50S ribosomal protein L6 n=1 Tax=Candidatus Chromulinivorax destructor TaxID=2066483 RepID=A0A345ZAY6_9BACT|nr:50S ribosomal protein L6 [Candidatus Chromulinivorax destructor]AXK60453.1 50S ribosomal protein L6 [Candidatus Chromulinivorax destructor]
MSKVGRRSISTANVSVSIDGQNINYKGPQAEGTHVLPGCLKATLEGDQLAISLVNPNDDKNTKFWGLHRALVFNEISGSREKFRKEVKIVGLGFKGILQGNEIVFSLGYSHKINFTLPENVTVEIDKTGQNIVVVSTDKFLAGDVAQKIRALRLPEPYKGTGIRFANQVIVRKAGKTKGDK